MAKIFHYSISSTVLAVLLTTCVLVFSRAVRSEVQKWSDIGMNGTTPKLGFIPMPENNESTLIWVQGTNRTNTKNWSSRIQSSLETYYYEKKYVSRKSCSYIDPPKSGEVCNIDIREWGPCNQERYYNYHMNAPCIFLKLNKIQGWVPEYYNDTNNLPEDMPQQLKDLIKYNITRPEERNNIWISCTGETSADMEYLGPIKYYPSHQGFPGYYFPYTNSKDYFSPLIAVHFKRPASGVVLNIECRAWAKNIKYNKDDKSGFVHFELYIE
ncbi:sodium/potassium-transporting ATPase subunit beta-2-like [Harmonia axyridis]|uniref:sodium/potassium-transporting ATPase subunit beta-2-like n=1 Tax=Harmonia axyridis TaxID=115357 RepID=UPI001E27744F|nr:sodium/potassium-transporting ATPase subunit beta-2-like [Harmonia axyridis]